jgi:hypothetical protein
MACHHASDARKLSNRGGVASARLECGGWDVLIDPPPVHLFLFPRERVFTCFSAQREGFSLCLLPNGKGCLFTST